MSRIGKKVITIPSGVQVKVENSIVSVKGPKGELKEEIRSKDVLVNISDSDVSLTRNSEDKKVKAMHGLYRALIQNMVTGTSEGFTRKLELVGIGFKVELKQKYVVLSLGYSHPIYFRPPDEVKIEAPSPTSVVVSGIDKELVGSVSAKIRSFRKPEPYKGKGVRYEGEEVRRKEGKTASK